MLPAKLRHLLRSTLVISLLNALSKARQNDCVGACSLSLNHIRFSDIDPDSSYYVAQCRGLKLTSIFLCTETYCSTTEKEYGWHNFERECLSYGNITIPTISELRNASKGIDPEHFHRSHFDNVSLFTSPAIPDPQLFSSAVRSQNAWNESEKTRTRYGMVMIIYWLLVALAGIIARVLFQADRRPSKNDLWKFHLGRLPQRWLTVPATFGYHCAQHVGWCTIPPRLESLLIATFVLLNILLCIISYNVFSENLIWPPAQQWSRYIADRTGVISIANLPLIWLFATRNNIVLNLTGWSFETAMHFHRWIARVSTVEAIVHSIAYTILVFQEGSWARFKMQLTYRYWNMGILATIVMTLICVVSIRPIRELGYEMFLAGHILSGVLTLLGMWYHVEIFNGAYNWFIWPSLFIWASDRIWRVVRLILINRFVTYSKLEYSVQANMLRLSVPVSSKFQPKPGEYYFIYAFHGTMMLQSHPFTACSWTSNNQSIREPQLNFIIRPYNGFTRRLANMCHETKSYGNEISSGRCVRMLIEGPHGPAHDLKQYSSLLFIVGGTGVAVVTAYLNDMLWSKALQQCQYRICNFRIVWAVQDLMMASAVYEQELLPLLDGLKDEAFRQIPEIRLELYVTRSQTPILTRSSTELDVLTADHGGLDAGIQCTNNARDLPANSYESASQQFDPHEASPLMSPSSTSSHSQSRLITESSNDHPTHGLNIVIHYGCRPDIAELVIEASRANQRTSSPDQLGDEKLAVISCGPPSLSDATRAAVVKALQKKDCASLTFFNESYTW